MDKEEIKEVVREADELASEAAPPAAALPPLAIPDIAVGRIFLFLGLFYAAAIAVRLLFIEGPALWTLIDAISKSPSAVPATTSVLYDFFLYMCLACQFFPIPTLPPIAFAAKIFHPVVISAVGAAGTCVANLNDYAILGWLFRHHRVRKVRDVRTYRRLLHFFDRYAFLTLSVAAFLPIPVDVIRLLAISRAYSFIRYILATFVGRFPRYLILAYLGKELPAKYIMLLFLVTLLPGIVKFVSDIIRKKRQKRQPE